MKKECKHKFHSVYYVSEWEVECEKCSKNVRDLYNKKDANEIVENLLLITNHQRYSYHGFGTAQESIDEERYLNPKTKNEEYVKTCIFLVITLIIIITLTVWSIIK